MSRENNNVTKNVLIIDGTISSGKSTTIKHLEQKYKTFTFIKEPIESFSHELKQFYDNPNNNTCYDLQYKILCLWYETFNLLNHSTNNMFIIERSPMNATIFIEQNKDLLTIDQRLQLITEFNLLEEILFEKYNTKRIYLKCNDETIINRNMNRKYDNTIDHSYLINLNTIYDNRINQEDNILVIDNNCSIENTLEQIDSYIYEKIFTNIDPIEL